MANKNKWFHLGILFMFFTLAVGSRLRGLGSEGFPSSEGLNLRRLSEGERNNSSNPGEKSNKRGDLGLGESQNKKRVENGSEVVTHPRSISNTGGVTANDDHSNLSPPGNSSKGLKQDNVKNEGSQSGNGDSTGNGDPPRKKKSKTPKNDDLGTTKNDTGSHPEKDLVVPKQDLSPPQQNSEPLVDTKGSNNQTENNGTVTYPPPAKGIEPPPGKDIEPPPVDKNNKSSTDTGIDGDQEKSGDKPNKDTGHRDSRNEPVCDEAHSCTDHKKIVACLRAPGNEMQVLSVLIQNKGEETLHVYINASAFLKIDPLNSTLEKQESTTVQVSMINPIPQNPNLSKIVINGGDEECILYVPNQFVNLPYKQSFFDGFPYQAILTPMFGVYLLLFSVLAIGGSWLCCKLRGKRRHGDGIKYQELEMNHPDSNLSTNGGKLEAESMDGWDEWDDTWEDAEAGRSSTRPIQTVSSNGLASRRSNKDGWDNSWDD